jgi:predicted NAD/FAD-dependent oxidoreductase
MAGITCARTLAQAGHRVTVFEKSHNVSGRMATRTSPFGNFDHGTQYFTVRDPRFKLALDSTPSLCKAWSANTIRVLDERGRVAAASLPPKDFHWVATPGMSGLVRRWAQPLAEAQCVEMQTRVTHIEPDSLNKDQWQLRTAGVGDSSHVFSGFDAVVLAIPSPQAQALLQTAPKKTAKLLKKMEHTAVEPCWTLMLAFPLAVQPGLTILGPQWNAARSTHHRIAWLARESSKPGRKQVERWTIQASAAWSAEHINDDPSRVQAKLHKAFSEVTGIRAEPGHMETHRWLYAKTSVPLGQSHLWDTKSGLGVCGDWCTGHRVEDAFVSGLELALSMA